MAIAAYRSSVLLTVAEEDGSGISSDGDHAIKMDGTSDVSATVCFTAAQ